MLYAIHCESVKNEKQRLEEENQRIKEEETLIRINSTSPSKMTEEDIECLVKIFRKLGHYHPEYEKERSKLINICTIATLSSNKAALNFIRGEIPYCSNDKIIHLSDICLRVSDEYFFYNQKGFALLIKEDEKNALKTFSRGLKTFKTPTPPKDFHIKRAYEKQIAKTLISQNIYRNYKTIEFGFCLAKAILIKRLHLSRKDEAKELLLFLLSIIDNDAHLYRLFADIYKENKNYKKAKLNYELALNLASNPGNSGNTKEEREKAKIGIEYCKNEIQRQKFNHKMCFSDVKTGLQYEEFIERTILSANFKCNKTSISNDQGVDIIVSLKKIKVAIQCKFYKNKVSNSAVQEVVAGQKYYKCKKACVVSPVPYTIGAQKLAKANNVTLLHHSDLIDWLHKLLNTPQ